MRIILILCFYITFSSVLNSKDYKIYVDGRILVGEIDSLDSNEITFYFKKLDSETQLFLDVSETSIDLSQKTIEGCFKNIEDSLLVCRDFQVINNSIMIKEIDYFSLMGIHFTIKLYFDSLKPEYFIFFIQK